MKTISLTVRAIVATLVISCFVAANVTHAQPAPTLNPAFKAEPLVSGLFKAIQENDFKALYNMDFTMQAHVRQIQSDGPQFLADKKLQEDYQTQLSNLKSGSSDFTAEILNFARLNPETKIVETHARLLDNINYPKMWVHDIYTSLKFKSTESAPFVRQLNAFDNPQNQILKETVMNFIFSDSGYFMSVSRVPETDTTFTDIPFQILAVQTGTDGNWNAFLLGGTPPFTKGSQNPDGSITHYYENMSVRDPAPAGYKRDRATVSITDGLGHVATASLVFPAPGDSFMFIRSPWYQNDLYLTVGLLDRRQQVYQLSESSPSTPTTAPESANGADESGAIASIKAGRLKLSSKDYTGAISDFTKAIALTVRAAGAYEGRGFAKRMLKDYDGAVADLSKALELNPKFTLAYNERGNTKFALKDFQGAIADYTHALELNPKDAVYFDNRGNAKRNLKDYDAAISDYVQAIALNPTNGMFYDHRAIVKADVKDYYGAIADYTQAIGLNPADGMVYNRRGLAKMGLKDYYGAIADYTQAIALFPKDSFLYDNRGNAKRDLKDYEGAIADYIKAIDVRTAQFPEGSEWSATIRRFLAGTLAESEFLNSAMNTDGDSKVKSTQVCQANYYAGVKRLLARDKDGAMDLFTKCLDTGQTNHPTFKGAEMELKLLKNEPAK